MNQPETKSISGTTLMSDRAATHLSQVQETEFEKARGVSRVEIRTGYAQVHVSQLKEPLSQSRIKTLERVAKAGVSIDFLKLTQSGVSFMVREDDTDKTAEVLEGVGHSSVKPGRSLVLVHAVNIRDEEGLLASIVSTAIESGASMDHLSEMHDRVLIGTTNEDSEKLARALSDRFLGGTA